MGESGLAKLYVPCASAEEASSLAGFLLKKRLVACTTSFPVQSQYWWKGAIQAAEEHILLLTTRKELVQEVRKAIEKKHSYDVPCILELDVLSANASYAQWVVDETRQEANQG